jgi:hypothetical protein
MMLVRIAAARAHVGVSRSVTGGLIGVVMVCLGSFRVEIGEIACFGSYR